MHQRAPLKKRRPFSLSDMRQLVLDADIRAVGDAAAIKGFSADVVRRVGLAHFRR
jgi:hypothetical protein